MHYDVKAEIHGLGPVVSDSTIDDFIRKSVEADEIELLIGLFNQAIERFEFDVIAYFVVRRGFRNLDALEGSRFHSPPGLLNILFADGQPVDFDPVVARALDRMDPFHWFDLEDHPELSNQQREIFARLRADNFEDGLTIPVMSRPGDLALFAFSARNRRLDLTEVQLRLLQHACQATHRRYEELVKSEPMIKLSPRETDVMRLVAAGKSNAEIAVQLTLSTHTVDTLIRRSFAKLGVTNRIEASIKLAYSGVVAA